jgi:ADP-L-glycero-D-manno-heptose 6-epimerase
VPFVYASSAAVYGTGDEPFSEDDRHEAPLNVYGFSKLAFDHFVRQILPRVDSPVVGLRYFNVYGPRENHKQNMASVIYKMVMQHHSSETLKLFRGSSGYLRDFVHVDDIVDVNLHFFQSRASGIFNCGTGKTRSFQELGEIVAAQLGGARIEMIDMPAILEAQYQKYTCSDNTRLRQSGYAGEFRSLEAGIRDYIDTLRASRNDA